MNIAKSNLYQLFNSLSGEELKMLAKAVDSPFFNYRDDEKRLFEYLLKAKKSKADMLGSEEVCFYVFGNKKNEPARLRHVMTYLLRIINRCIVIHEMEQAEEQKRLLLMRSLRKRNLSKQFLAIYYETKNYFAHQAPVSPSLYYHQLQLHTEYYSYSITNRRAQNENLQRLSDELDSFYIIEKLKHACNILSYKNIFKFDYQPRLAEEIMILIEGKNMLANPLVSLLYFNYLCLSEPDNEQHFVQLKKALLTDSARIEIKELKDLYTLAINYCIKRLNTGGQKYYQQVFEIYQSGLQRLVFEEDGKLSPFTYKNISAIATGLKEYKWAASFIENYKGRLDKNIRDGFYAYCMARYYFALEDYERVSDLLREVEIKEQFTDLDARVLLIKTYYELNEFGLLDYSIGNLKQYLKRKKLQTYHETVYKNFTKMVSQLVHLRPYDKKAKAGLKEKLSATREVAEKEWLILKVGN